MITINSPTLNLSLEFKLDEFQNELESFEMSLEGCELVWFIVKE